MVVRESYDDVTRLRFSGPGARLVGMDVSVYLTRGAFVTHWHEDHAGNVSQLAARGLPTWLADETRTILAAAPPIRFYRRAVWGAPPRLTTVPEPFTHPSLEPIHTPGHSHEHHVIWDAESETVFSGDLWLGVRSRVMHEDEHPRTIVASLERVRALHPKRMFDAHRGEVADPIGALGAKIDWLRETIEAIERRVAEGWSDGAIVRDVLGGEEWVARASFGEYARRNLVRAVREGR